MEEKQKNTQEIVQKGNVTKEEKTSEVKNEKKDSVSKNFEEKSAIIRGLSLPISTKHAMAICNFIRGKDLDKSISELERVASKKLAIPMRGEIPHKKGMMSGRCPINAINQFIRLLKGLKANAIVKEIEFEKYRLACKANVASRPYRRFGKGKFKRTHVTIKLVSLDKPLDI